jgi:hypothetical protein
MGVLPQPSRESADAIREAQAETPRLVVPRGRTQRGRVTVHGQITELLKWDFPQDRAVEARPSFQQRSFATAAWFGQTTLNYFPNCQFLQYRCALRPAGSH